MLLGRSQRCVCKMKNQGKGAPTYRCFPTRALQTHN
jgi:hypothetical protein